LEARVISLIGCDGATYNALDTALMESVVAGESPPTLLFAEVKPTVSLGNSQSLSLDVNYDECKRRGVDVVRRRSGGQVVYIDKGYLLFGLIAPRNIIPGDLSAIRESFSRVMADTLRWFGIPVEYRAPDNVVIAHGGHVKTLGNSGQVISGSYVYLQGSIRYSLEDLPAIMDTLKINGHTLHPFEDEIANILGNVITYNPDITKKELQNALVGNFAKAYGLNFAEGSLTNTETKRIADMSHPTEVSNRLQDKPTYKSRGVCYFFVGGENLVPSSRIALDYSAPSTVADSTVELGVVKIDRN